MNEQDSIQDKTFTMPIVVDSAVKNIDVCAVTQTSVEDQWVVKCLETGNPYLRSVEE